MAWVEKRGDGFRSRYRIHDGSLHSENGFTTQEADVESDQWLDRFVDPRLAQTTIDEWIRVWSEDHHVSDITRPTYAQARFVFAGADGGLRRRSNFRHRAWLPALVVTRIWTEVRSSRGCTFHDLRRTHKAWLIEDGVPQVVQHQRRAQDGRRVRGRWAVRRRALRKASVLRAPCSQFAPTTQKRHVDEDHRLAV